MIGDGGDFGAAVTLLGDDRPVVRLAGVYQLARLADRADPVGTGLRQACIDVLCGYLGLALGVGLLELMVDAFPGIMLSFQTHLTLTQFGVNRPAWAPTALDDQHTAGGILWAVAEVLDLPFLVLAATKWMRADAVEARRVDAELDAESPHPAASTAPQRPADGTAVPVVAGEAPTAPAHPDAPPMTRPWWLDDPELRDRYRS